MESNEGGSQENRNVERIKARRESHIPAHSGGEAKPAPQASFYQYELLGNDKMKWWCIVFSDSAALFSPLQTYCAATERQCGCVEVSWYLAVTLSLTKMATKKVLAKEKRETKRVSMKTES